MIWLGVALLSGAVAGVGFWRGTPAGLASETMPALAGVLFGLVMFRATSLVNDQGALTKQGGWPLRVSGALALTATLAAAIDAAVWFESRRASFGQLALPTAVLAFTVLFVTSLRFAADSKRRTHFFVLAFVAIVNAAISAWFFVSLQLPAISQ